MAARLLKQRKPLVNLAPRAVVVLGHTITRATGAQHNVALKHNVSDASWASLSAAYRAVGGTKQSL